METGAVIGVGLPDLTAMPILGGDLITWWAPHPRLQLGVQLGMGMTMLPYGCTEAVPFIGERGHSGCGEGLGEDFTLLPRVLFDSRFFVTPSTTLGANLGMTFVVSRVTWGLDYEFVPYPTAGVVIETKLGAAGRFGLRAGLSYIHIAYRESRGFLAPTLAFGWR